MNYEQFYFWLKGYIDSHEEYEVNIQLENIEKHMNLVIVPKSLTSHGFQTIGSTGIVPFNNCS